MSKPEPSAALDDAFKEGVAMCRARIRELEAELEQAAEIVQRLHPIGAVKAVGIREVSAGLAEVEKMFRTCQAREAALRKALEAKQDSGTLCGRCYNPDNWQQECGWQKSGCGCSCGCHEATLLTEAALAGEVLRDMA